jgi:hypothetical protein
VLRYLRFFPTEYPGIKTSKDMPPMDRITTSSSPKRKAEMSFHSLWDSIDGLSRLVTIANWGIAASLLLGFAFTAIVIKAGGRKDELVAIEDLRKAEQIAVTMRLAGEAHERAAKAELDLAKLKAVRTLNSDQQDRIVTKLRQFSGTPFVLAVNPDAESIDFMGIVAGTLMAAKWVWESAPKNVDRIGPLEAAIWYRAGLAVTIRSEHTTKLMKAADGLASALQAEGLTVETGLVPANVAGNPDAVHIIIGSKPQN